MIRPTHHRQDDPPDARFPEPYGHTLRAWLNTMVGAGILGLLAFIANGQADSKAQTAIINYRLSRIEQELGIKPVSLNKTATIASAE